MIRAASGAAQSAREIFRAPAFDADKQPLIVRQAYIEVRLQNLLALSASGKCEAIDDRVGTIGLEDRDIAFTLYGFGQFIRTPHFQYYLGVVEANCGLHKQAQKYWTNVAKAKASPSSPEFAYPLLASTRLQADPSKTPAAGAAKSLPFPAQEDATGDSVRALNQALALRAAGDESGTLALLAKIVNGTTDIMVRYLAVTEMKLKFP